MNNPIPSKNPCYRHIGASPVPVMSSMESHRTASQQIGEGPSHAQVYSSHAQVHSSHAQVHSGHTQVLGTQVHEAHAQVHMVSITMALACQQIKETLSAITFANPCKPVPQVYDKTLLVWLFSSLVAITYIGVCLPKGRFSVLNNMKTLS